MRLYWTQWDLLFYQWFSSTESKSPLMKIIQNFTGWKNFLIKHVQKRSEWKEAAHIFRSGRSQESSLRLFRLNLKCGMLIVNSVEVLKNLQVYSSCSSANVTCEAILGVIQAMEINSSYSVFLWPTSYCRISKNVTVFSFWG